MVQKIIKRDGRIVPFSSEKIQDAIKMAFAAVDDEVTEYAEAKAKNIADYIMGLDTDTLGVEEVQDYVEHGLMSCKRKDVARAYITYRNDREKIRRSSSEFIKTIGDKLSAVNVLNLNANVDERTFGGRKGEAANQLVRQYVIDNILSDLSRNNHLDNRIYIHDLCDYTGMTNCLTAPIDDLLAKGFVTRQTDIRPAGSLSTAFQLVAVIFQCISLCQFGGVSASHLDWSMVPYYRKSFAKHYRDGLKFISKIEDRGLPYDCTDISIENREIYDNAPAWEYAYSMTNKELHQAVQGLMHNLNSLQSRAGSQLPFSSINYGSCTLKEGQLIIEALLDGILEGTGPNHRTAIFPCGIFKLKKGINRNPGDPNYYLFRKALECTSKRIYPNYANLDWSVNQGYDPNDPSTEMATMGCRTYNGADINADPGVNPQIKDGRGNLAPVTIILPTLAMEAISDDSILGSNLDKFITHLKNAIGEAYLMLKQRYDIMCAQDPSAAPFIYDNNCWIGFDGKTVESALKHGTLVVGSLGLAECLQILIHKNHTTPEGLQAAKRIYQTFNQECKKLKEQTHLNIGVYLTPAENLCYSAMNKFKEKYGIIENVSDHEYFTNSIHVPVWENVTPFEKIDIESQLACYSNAGCITYVEVDGKAYDNIDALEAIVNYAMDKDIPYFALNVPIQYCNDCHYESNIMEDTCPICGSSNVDHLARVTGYLSTTVKHFNKGKQAEVAERRKHLQW